MFFDFEKPFAGYLLKRKADQRAFSAMVGVFLRSPYHAYNSRVFFWFIFVDTDGGF
jgi:hypothetical protein